MCVNTRYWDTLEVELLDDADRKWTKSTEHRDIQVLFLFKSIFLECLFDGCRRTGFTKNWKTYTKYMEYTWYIYRIYIKDKHTIIKRHSILSCCQIGIYIRFMPLFLLHLENFIHSRFEIDK